MTANPPQQGGWHHDSVPALDPRALPFPAQFDGGGSSMPVFGCVADMGLPLPQYELEHGPYMMPISEPAYGGMASVDPAQPMLTRRRVRLSAIITVALLLVAGGGAAIAWNATSSRADHKAKASSASDDTTASSSDTYGVDGASGFGAGETPSSVPSIGGPGAPTPDTTAAANGRGAAGATLPSQARTGGITGGGFGGAPTPAAGALPQAGDFDVVPTHSDGVYHPAPAVQPVAGGAAVTGAAGAAPTAGAAAPTPGGAAPTGAAPAGAPPHGAMPPVTGAGAAAPQAQGTANAAQPSAQPNVAHPAAAAAARPAATPALVIIGLKTTAGTWQLYRTDPRRVVLAENAARFDTRGAMTGYVWVGSAWQAAVILARPVA